MQRPQPPPPPAAAAGGQSTSSSSAAPPTRSIFDIEKSPFSGAGIEKLLAPIMSPANLSDVSDLANDNGNALIAESAAEVPLEPGEIFDTPTSAGGANSIFNFPPSAAPAKSASSKSASTAPSIGSMLGIGPEHYMPPVKEVKRESGSWAGEGSRSSSSSHSAKSSRAEALSGAKHTVKLEPLMSASALGLPIAAASLSSSSKKTPSPTKQPKQRSLFSPPAETSSAPPPFKPEPGRSRTTSSSSSASATSPSVKLSKLEQMPGYEKLKDGRTSVRLPKEERTPATPPTSMKVSLPMAAVTSGSKAAEAETKRDEGLTAADQHRSEKKKKKKEKKEKKEKRDKDKKDEKRHKHKHKDKDRDKEGSSSNRGASATPGSTASNSPAAAATATPSSGLKLKVKLPPTPGGGEGQGQSHVAPLRLSLGEKTDSGSSKKRKPSEASGGPASKMSRVLGTPLELENGYVRDKGIGGSKK